MTTLSYYEVLGVDENATFDEIKKAYRKMALKYHTDRAHKNNFSESENTSEIMSKINEAYETLGDEQMRKNYDEQQRVLHPENTFFHPNTNNIRDFDNLFQALFKGTTSDSTASTSYSSSTASSSSSSAAAAAAAAAFFPHLPAHINNIFMQKPAPIIKHITITFEQVFNGATVPIQIDRWTVDSGCKTIETETLYVSIPPGVDENEMIVLKEKGNCLGEQKGDVKIFIKVNNTTEFKRNGLDLFYDKNITLKEALCGFSFQFTFLDNKVYTLNNVTNHHVIPPEYKKSIPNMGLKRSFNETNSSNVVTHQGQLIIIFHVSFPETLTTTQITTLKSIL